MELKVRKTGENLSYSGYNIYVGLDVHKKSWSVRIIVGDQEYKGFSQDPKVDLLVSYLDRHFPGGTYYCAYEAGFSGFWIYEQLEARGINCLVIHPADVPTTDKERRQKTDRIDARKIARGLSNGSLNGVYCPSQEQQSFRSLVRTRLHLQRDITRLKNRIKMHLLYFGIEIPVRWQNRNWSGRFINWLEKVEFKGQEAKFSLEIWIESLKTNREQLAKLDKSLLKISKQACWAAQMELLLSISGIGQVSSLILLSEIGPIERFKHLDQLASYVGLVPNIRASGEKEHIGAMTRRGNAYLRYILIEAAWRAIRNDSVLHLSYQKLIQRMKPQQAIVRIARKLLNRIRFVLKNGVLYQVNYSSN